MDADKKKYQVKRLYDAAFPADREWNNWFFDRVYRDDDTLVVEDENGAVVSSLCLHKYKFAYQDSVLPFAYISGAVTAYKSRHKGYMSALLIQALRQSYERGDALIGLIPATRRLYSLYDKFGFATVVYADIERYTAVHDFALTEDYELSEPTYEGFKTLVAQRHASVVYSEEDFENIMYDIRHDGGVVTAVNDAEGKPAAMAFATADKSEIHVKELLGEDPRASEMALGEVKNALASELPMAVWTMPSGRPSTLRARGMMRIVNAHTVLSALAGHNPDLRTTLRLTDPYIDNNNGVFQIEKGKCRYFALDEDLKSKIAGGLKIDLDVRIDVLTSILFSSETTGRIFNLPTCRPSMSLMLD